MNAKLHQLTTGLNEWNVTYTTVNVPELNISAAFEEVVDTELKVEPEFRENIGYQTSRVKRKQWEKRLKKMDVGMKDGKKF